jgi:hypothetical protein
LGSELVLSGTSLESKFEAIGREMMNSPASRRDFIAEMEKE